MTEVTFSRHHLWVQIEDAVFDWIRDDIKDAVLKVLLSVFEDPSTVEVTEHVPPQPKTDSGPGKGSVGLFVVVGHDSEEPGHTGSTEPSSN